MKIKSEKDFWSGLMFVATGLGFAWGATGYEFGDSARPGPAYFPFGLGILLALLGALVLFKSLTLEVDGGDSVRGWALKPLAVIMGAVALFGFALPRIGLLLALPLLVVLVAMAGSEFRWRDAIASALVLTVASWALFVWGLGLLLPLLPAAWLH